MKNLIVSGSESPFLLFSLLLPVTVVEPLMVEDEYQDLERMIQCKSQFDMVILSGGIYAGK
jgi:molybdopterin biosynthesis enzyme